MACWDDGDDGNFWMITYQLFNDLFKDFAKAWLWFSEFVVACHCWKWEQILFIYILMAFNVSTFYLSVSLWHSHWSNLIRNTSITMFCVAHVLLLDMKKLRLMRTGCLAEITEKLREGARHCYWLRQASGPHSDFSIFFLIEFIAGNFSIPNVVSHRCFHNSYDIWEIKITSFYLKRVS